MATRASHYNAKKAHMFLFSERSKREGEAPNPRLAGLEGATRAPNNGFPAQTGKLFLCRLFDVLWLLNRVLSTLCAELAHLLERLLAVLCCLARGVALRTAIMGNNELSFSHSREDYNTKDRLPFQRSCANKLFVV